MPQCNVNKCPREVTLNGLCIGHIKNPPKKRKSKKTDTAPTETTATGPSETTDTEISYE